MKDHEPVEVAATATPDEPAETTPAPDNERVYELIIDKPTTIASGHQVTILSQGHKSIFAGQRGHSMWELTITREGSEPTRVPYGYDSGSPWFIEVMLPKDGLALTLQMMPALRNDEAMALSGEERGRLASMRELTVSSEPAGILTTSPPLSEEDAMARFAEIADARAREDGCDVFRGMLHQGFDPGQGVFMGVYQDGGDPEVRCEVVIGGYSGRVASSKYERERIQDR